MAEVAGKPYAFEHGSLATKLREEGWSCICACIVYKYNLKVTAKSVKDLGELTG
jgi:hypothetical protein